MAATGRGHYTAGLLRLRGNRSSRITTTPAACPAATRCRARSRQAPRRHDLDRHHARTGPDAQWRPRSSAPGTVAAQSSSWRCTWLATAACGWAPRTGRGAHRRRARAAGRREQVGDAQDVFDFHEDADGTIWMASDRGLLRYRDGRAAGARGWRRGLPIDTLFAVVDDGVGGLWLTSNRGVMRVRRSDIDAGVRQPREDAVRTMSAGPTASPALVQRRRGSVGLARPQAGRSGSRPPAARR